MMMWDESSGLRDDMYRSATGLLSLDKPAKKAPPGCGPGNASPTVKSKMGHKGGNTVKRKSEVKCDRVESLFQGR